MRRFKLSENVSNMSVGMEGHHGKANTGGSLQPLEGRPEQRAKPVLLAAALWGPLILRLDPIMKQVLYTETTSPVQLRCRWVCAQPK